MKRPIISWWQWSLAPLAAVYGAGVWVRNTLYGRGWLKSVKFNVPTVSVGNLSVGGSGKTPHIEYLIRLLSPYIEVATLSRGYKRRTTGYRAVATGASTEQVGDEPLQFKRKFPSVFVAVSESRVLGIPSLLQDAPQTQVILLDDAFQHRPVRVGLNILLTEFQRPFARDFLLPVGRLREFRAAYKRADLLVVTKCPLQMSAAVRREYEMLLRPHAHQQLFFSYFSYQTPYHWLDSAQTLPLDDTLQAVVICAIAKTDYLVEFLDRTLRYAEILEHPDHHYFTTQDLDILQARYTHLNATSPTVVLTTEKDATRLFLHRSLLESWNLPIYVLPIAVVFHDQDGDRFDAAVKNYLLGFR